MCNLSSDSGKMGAGWSEAEPTGPEDWMNRTLTVLVFAAVIAVAACQYDASMTWFDGDLDAAKAEAGQRDTVIMIEFYADWCNWCRRLESDTLTAPDVRRQLEQIVAMRLDAEKAGAKMARRFGIDSYPTMVFLDADGHEMDRIIGFLPPEKFVRRIERIRTGDTFLACLRQLEEDPGNVEAIQRSVGGLLERSDPEGAIARIESFHQATEGSELALCRKLMFAARGELHNRVYQRAAKLYHRGWDRSFDVPDTTGTSRLFALLESGVADLPADDQARRLRDARFGDAADLLEIPDLENAAPETLLSVADFAFRNGHYDHAAKLYLRWDGFHGQGAKADVLNDVAWRLYLSRLELDAAVDIAQRSYSAEPEPETADTLARLLYATGSVKEAISLEELAARNTEGSRSEAYSWVAGQMGAGEPLDDEPNFESYPGQRRRAL
jgi:thioredoxin-related protein